MELNVKMLQLVYIVWNSRMGRNKSVHETTWAEKRLPKYGQRSAQAPARCVWLPLSRATRQQLLKVSDCFFPFFRHFSKLACLILAFLFASFAATLSLLCKSPIDLISIDWEFLYFVYLIDYTHDTRATRQWLWIFIHLRYFNLFIFRSKPSGCSRANKMDAKFGLKANTRRIIAQCTSN